ncbi:hypothetical protein COD67_07395 [Bacillus cereus]|nr:hypothetical protein COI89_04000 [Bacillus cereus]PGU68213.1 hypothetical protein COD67_07395 [Bacillus cereus]
MISVFLISFANFSSIRMISGAVKGLTKNKKRCRAIWFKLLYGFTLVSILSAIIVSIML